MSEDVEVRLEALKLIKEFAVALIVLQTAVIGVAASLLEKHPPEGWRLAFTAAMFAAFLVAIYIGAVCVIGTIPAIAQKLPAAAGRDIYGMTGGLSGEGRWTLGRFCLWQAHLFMLSLVLFVLFVLCMR